MLHDSIAHLTKLTVRSTRDSKMVS